MSNALHECDTQPALAQEGAIRLPSRPDLAAEVIGRSADLAAEGQHGGRALVPNGSGDLGATQDYDLTEEIDVGDATVDYGSAAPAASAAAAGGPMGTGITSSLGLAIPTALVQAFAGAQPAPLPAPPGLRRPGPTASSGGAAAAVATRRSGAAADRAMPVLVLPPRGHGNDDTDRSRSRIDLAAPADVNGSPMTRWRRASIT